MGPLITIMENWNQEQLERNSHFHGIYIKCQGHRKWPKTLSGVESMDKYFHFLIQMKGIEPISIET